MILVYAETTAEGVNEVSLETVTFARKLATAGGGVPIDAVLVGPCPEGAAAQLAAYGVRTVHHADGEDFDRFSGAATATAVAAARQAAGSVVVMAGGTNRGMDVMARVATRAGVAMAANVVAFGGLSPFVVTRQVVGGAALEEMRLSQRPAVFTVAGHAVEPEPAAEPGAGTVQSLQVELAPEDLLVRVVSAERAAPDESGSLKSARIVVGAGRGAGGPDGFKGVIELADLLGGSLGVSRVVTSLGWRPHHEQVGQTGSRIAPEVYIPCGISGAIQHWAGCASSKVIIAINTDAEAPMMTKATYAVVGDMHEVVPAINEELRQPSGLTRRHSTHRARAYADPREQTALGDRPGGGGGRPGRRRCRCGHQAGSRLRRVRGEPPGFAVDLAVPRRGAAGRAAGPRPGQAGCGHAGGASSVRGGAGRGRVPLRAVGAALGVRAGHRGPHATQP